MRPVTLTDWQGAVDQWIERNGRYWTPLAQLARLTEEVGELARAINLEHGDKRRTAKDPPSSVAEETGDVLFVLMALANDLHVDLQQALGLTLAKAEARVQSGATRSRVARGRRGTAARGLRRPAPRHPSSPD